MPAYARSVERLALLTPAEAVRRPQQRAHPNAVIRGVTARIARDHDLVARLQRFARDTLAGQRTGATPLDAPPLHLPVLVGRHDVHPRVRVAEHELHELALDLDGLALVVGRGERMMRVGRQSNGCGTQ